MNRSIILNNSRIIHYLSARNYTAKAKYAKKNWNYVKSLTKNTDLALDHFDSLYSKVYGRCWPSIRLGLLSPKKHVAILNTFVDTDNLQDHMINELEAVNLQRYYKKHLQSYTRMQLRQQIIDNKKARKRELMAKNQDVNVESIDLNSIEVSDISDSELRGAESTDASDGGFSTAEDLQDMFSDRRMDDNEKYFINKASTRLSLEDYMPATELISQEDTPDEYSYYEGFKQDIDINIEFKEEPSLEFGNELKILSFPKNSWEKFQQPQRVPIANLLPYYLLDGASILPVLALDLRLGDICADYCAAPGGKSLAMMMTLKPKYLLCNDSSINRSRRLSSVMRLYLPSIDYNNSTLEMTRFDAKNMVYPDFFDKILVDVPCSNDRNSVETLENNIFKRGRIEERLKLPSMQCDILKSALKSLKPKGSVVYSTCTLSPIENDGVVQRALIQLREEDYPHKFAVVNLKEAFRPLRGLFRFNTKFMYGQQVLPSVCSNFGPMYISKIKRLT